MTEIPSTPPGDGPASLWKKLGASAEPLRLLTQNSLEILSILDGEGRMLYQSPSIRHVLGYPEEALLGHNVFDYIHPDDRSRLEAQFEQQCARPGATATFQYRFLHADGSWRDFESLTQNLALEPLIGGVVATSRDVTERERAERALRESEERFRAQYRGIPVPTCTWQRRGEAFVLTDCNEAALAYTEGGIHAFMGRTDGELYAEEPRIREMLRRCHATQRILQYDSPCRVRSTGLAREFHVHFVPVPPDLVMVHTEDVMEQRQAERALRQSEERIRHLVETVNVIPWEADPVALRFTYVGPQAVQILGYPLREWYAEDFWTSHLHPDDRERTVELCRDASR
ncbi:MAG TPA: PAS domain S-box protein, partial [Armatimonadota bacterium]|nr:PAS domain S-box protein [Armatimonadota bacterium]